MTPDELKKFHDERLLEIEDYHKYLGDVSRGMKSTRHAIDLTKAFRAAMAEIERLEKANKQLLATDQLRSFKVLAAWDEVNDFKDKLDEKEKEIARLREGLEEAKVTNIPDSGLKEISEAAQTLAAAFHVIGLRIDEHNARIEKALGRGERRLGLA